MCEGCYEGFGRPAIVNDKTIACAAMIAEVYERDCVGGNLHVQLDDWNIEDDFFEDAEMEVWHNEASAEQIDVERKCYAAMKAMTLAERASALALFDGYLSAENQETDVCR